MGGVSMEKEIMELLLRLVTCTVGAVGFSVLFYIPPKRIPTATLGAALTIGIYLALAKFAFADGGEFLPNLIAALVGAIYCEVLARVTKTPVPVYLIPALITLAPGRLLYFTMSHLVNANHGEALHFAMLTVQAALGIAGGIIGASVVGIFLRLAARRMAERHRRLTEMVKREK